MKEDNNSKLRLVNGKQSIQCEMYVQDLLKIINMLPKYIDSLKNLDPKTFNSLSYDALISSSENEMLILKIRYLREKFKIVAQIARRGPNNQFSYGLNDMVIFAKEEKLKKLENFCRRVINLRQCDNPFDYETRK